jgi:hypothetical protein
MPEFSATFLMTFPRRAGRNPAECRTQSGRKPAPLIRTVSNA